MLIETEKAKVADESCFDESAALPPSRVIAHVTTPDQQPELGDPAIATGFTASARVDDGASSFSIALSLHYSLDMLYAPLLALLALPANAAPAASRSLSNSLPFRLTDGITRNLTHMSPLLSYDGDVSYVFTPPGTPDGTPPDDISGSHHVLSKGASVSFNFSGSAFVINGWSAEGATVKVREEPLGVEKDPGWGEWLRDVEDGREAWWTIAADEGKEVRASDAVPERTLVAVFGDGDDGARRVRLDVTEGEVWVSRVIAKTDIP